MKCKCDLVGCTHEPGKCKGNGTGGRMATKEILCEYCFLKLRAFYRPGDKPGPEFYGVPNPNA